MKQEFKVMLASFLRKNRNLRNYVENKNKINLIEYLQESICLYSDQENTPAEQIKGMNRLLKDIIELDERLFDEQ